MIYKLKSKVTFGQYTGLTIEEVIEEDALYIEWALDNVDFFELDNDAVKKYNEAMNEGEYDPYDNGDFL